MIGSPTSHMRSACYDDSPPKGDCFKARSRAPHHLGVACILQRLSIVAAILLVTACIGHDPYITKFPQIALGDNRVRVIDLMGQPDSVNSVEVPLLRAEQLAWRAHGKGRIYLVLIVMDRTAAKFSVD
ncbi:MAG: hypothetical protein J5X21_06865 [Candidatus Accumulibacter sp.]|nr:hypothetical protein [Candidatus Accumulibacter conexus]